MADRQFIKNLVAIHQGWFEGDTARFPSVFNKEQFEKALALHKQRKKCQHKWRHISGYSDPTAQPYECIHCGEQIEKDVS